MTTWVLLSDNLLRLFKLRKTSVCVLRKSFHCNIKMFSPVIETVQGKIKGKVSETINKVEYFSFKGVPFAKPPIGELRFKAPQPPEPWQGVRDGTVDCSICIQYDRATDTLKGDEDCLYLNVYVPKVQPTTPLFPVMVFIHGGGFVFGNGTDDTVHSPDYLVERGVIVVSFNYRLGILGFLSLDCKGAPGNMGLKDQVQALKWIQTNIENFGGDPNNVTIFGVSAGGSSVEYLLLSPLAKGLFHKAIAESGSCLLAWAQNNNIKDLASRIPQLSGKALSNTDELLKYLINLPVNDLISYSMQVLATDKYKGGIHFGFVPTVERPGDWEPFLAKPCYEMLIKGEFTKVPYITGFNSRESVIMVSSKPQLLNALVKEKSFVEYLPFNLNDIEKNEMESKFKSVYLEGENKYNEEDAFAIDFLSDVDFIGGIYVSASLISRKNPNVYFYEFSYDGSQNYLKKKLNIDRKGACHGDEGGYIMRSEILPKKLSENDKLVRDRLSGMWTNHAKYGDPTPTTDDVITTKWKPITESEMACMFIDDKLTMKHDIYPERMKLFTELYNKQ